MRHLKMVLFGLGQMRRTNFKKNFKIFSKKI